MSTPSTRELFLRKVAFDVKRAETRADESGIFNGSLISPGPKQSFVAGIKQEEQRLAKLHAAVADLVEALEAEPLEITTRDGRPYAQWTKHKRVGEALVRLREVCEP